MLTITLLVVAACLLKWIGSLTLEAVRTLEA